MNRRVRLAGQAFCIAGLATIPLAIAATCAAEWGPAPEWLREVTVLVSLAMAAVSFVAGVSWQALRYRRLKQAPSNALFRLHGVARWVTLGVQVLALLELIALTFAWPVTSVFTPWAVLGLLIFFETLAVAVHTGVLAMLSRREPNPEPAS